jgi:RHS repeat-associated protein
MNRRGRVYYYGVDALGSFATLADSSGTVQNSYAYDSWGNVSPTETVANPFGYTAREFGDAGDWFYRARYYEPGIGRFGSEDPRLSGSHPVSGPLATPQNPGADPSHFLRRPLSEAWGAGYVFTISTIFSRPLSLFSYTDNHPVVFADPLGMDKPGCDYFDPCWQTTPIRHCCDLHDSCYYLYDCTMRSFLLTTVFSPCLWCNTAVVECLFRAAPIASSYPVVPTTTPNPFPAIYNQPQLPH